MSDNTPRSGLPLLAAAQAQKHVTHNEALLQLDALMFAHLLDRDLAAPPTTPGDGDTYLIAANASGAWVGQSGKLAYADGGAWRFYAPFAGLTAYVADEMKLIVFDGTDWADYNSLYAMQNVPLLGVNTTADATNKLAVKSNAVLFSCLDAASGGSGDVRITLNKDTTSDTGSFLFQTNYSGRAEFGLTGDDDFHIKVSPDGASWTDAIVLDATTGNIGLGTSPSAFSIDTLRSGGYAGIRTKSTHAPSGSSLLIINDTGAEVSFYNFGSANGSSYAGISSNDLAMFYYTGSNAVLFNNTGATPIVFGTSNVERVRVTGVGNLLIGTKAEGSGAAGVIGIANGTAPSSSPAGVGQLYVEGGALKYRGSSGTVTVLAPA